MIVCHRCPRRFSVVPVAFCVSRYEHASLELLLLLVHTVFIIVVCFKSGSVDNDGTRGPWGDSLLQKTDFEVSVDGVPLVGRRWWNGPDGPLLFFSYSLFPRFAPPFGC
ncbi:unnamed protein product [Soboliphyme baturini]|uniref:Secreted protein n=1 Tax=Soboliphyme baturini TaxID=241478 RepID=A0A183ISN6_9BILA|nr:unnamed protein product [Soboliphyme baturini]